MGSCLKIHRPWTAEELATADRMRLDGASFGQIGARLNRSRASVCGVFGRRRAQQEQREAHPLDGVIRLARLTQPIKQRTAEIIAASHCDLSPVLDRRAA